MESVRWMREAGSGNECIQKSAKAKEGRERERRRKVEDGRETYS